MDTGNNAWVLTSAALMLFMTPGLAFFYGGMVRSKNVLGMLMQNVFAMGLISVIWAVLGFSLAFGGNALLGNLDYAVHERRRPTTTAELALDDPGMTFFAFQMMFAVITPGADHRRHRRPAEVQRLRAVHRAVVADRLRPGRPLGVGRRRLDLRHAARSTSPAARRSTSTPASRRSPSSP